MRHALVLLAVAACQPALSTKITSSRTLRYDDAQELPHVRAASGIVAQRHRLLIAQDDAQYLGVVTDRVTALPLPAVEGRRQFATKRDKIDIEAMVQIDDEVWLFGSGSLPPREQIYRLVNDEPRSIAAGPLYQLCRAALGGMLNIEGVARVGDELWLFHRGNTGPSDRPAVARFSLAGVKAWLDGGPVPPLRGVKVYALGAVDGHPYGFTDATAVGDRVYFLAAAEASDNAIDDGVVPGSLLGVIDGRGIRTAPFTVGGKPVKAEGLAIDRAHHAWVVVDPDDPAIPSTLFEVALLGPW